MQWKGEFSLIELNATMIAQVVNFLILAAILRALAYKPVAKILKQRSDKIQDDLLKAEQDKKAAEQTLAQYKAQLADAQKKAADIIDKAELTARQERDAAIADTKKEIERLKQNAKIDILNEKNRAAEQIQKEIVALSIAAAEKVIAKNISSKDNDKLINDFINNLNVDLFNWGVYMLNIQIASKYANAIFEIAQDNNILQEVAEQLSLIQQNLFSLPDAVKFFQNPIIPQQAKKDLLYKAFNEDFSPIIINFLLLLVDKNRIGIFNDIFQIFTNLKNQALGIIVADVITAFPLSKQFEDKLSKKLQAISGKNIILRKHIDISILGGIIVSIGDKRIDGSAAGRLRALKNNQVDW